MNAIGDPVETVRAWRRLASGDALSMPTVASIDPGDVHVGLTSWLLDTGEMLHSEELSPEGAVDKIETFLFPSVIVVERFGAYPDSDFLAHDQMQTSELIGVIKDQSRRRGVRVIVQQQDCKNIARVTPRGRAVLRELRASGVRSQHAIDSAMHGVHFFHQNMRGPMMSQLPWRDS